MKKAILISKKLGLNILKTLRNELNNTIIVHPDDSIDPRSSMPDIKKFCNENNLSLTIASNRSHAEKKLIEYQPNFIFVCGWYWLISDKILKIANNGIFGLHNSVLPKYRGSSPLVWSIIDGGHTVGSSLFKIDPGMDTGKIAYQFQIEFNRNHNICDALNKIEKEHLKILPQVWQDLVHGHCVLVKQSDDEATYCANRLAVDGRINWRDSSTHIHDFIRAQSFPYPRAFTYFNKNIVHVEKTFETDDKCMSTPGQVIEIKHDGSVLVGCGFNSILQIERAAGNNGQVVKASKIINTISARLH